jgi:AP-2 complex subunit alpha
VQRHERDSACALRRYILGEFGYLVAEQPGKGGEEQFNALYQHFPNLSYKARALLLSSFIKLENNFEDIRTQVRPIKVFLQNT